MILRPRPVTNSYDIILDCSFVKRFNHIFQQGTCSDAMPFGTVDILQALLRDGSAALEIVPAKMYASILE